ncbi:MAG TPA: amidohydrolase family protein [Saprospiraceae bacterium]|nr:amidohydrolase family protein [Saprospiraceae bacterium]
MKKVLVIYFQILALSLIGQNYLIKDVNIIPIYKNEVLRKQSILIEDGVISQIGNYKEVKKLASGNKHKVINAKGNYVMPGLADMHVHLAEDSLISFQLQNYIAAGVTNIRVMDSKANQLSVLAKKRDAKFPISPNVFFSKVIKRDESYSKNQADSLMFTVKQSGFSFIKLFGLSDENTFFNLMNSAKEHHVIVCGHYPIYRQFGKAVMISMDTVLKYGYKSIEHLGGYTNYPETEFENLVSQTKKWNVFNCPTIDWDIISYDLLYPDEYKNRLTYTILPQSKIDDWESEYEKAIEKAGGKEKVIESRDKYKSTYDKKIKVLEMLYESHCELLIGGDAGNTFQEEGYNVYEEMVNWSKIGIDNYTILKSATNNSAHFFEQDSEWGVIKKGAKGDIIILDKNPLEDIKNIATVKYTICAGVLYANSDLMKLKEYKN